MPCYHPLTAWHSKETNTSGKRSLVFNPNKALQRDDPIEINCGQCIGCRLEKSRQWATRCLHEASLYEDNCFITLTFDEEHLHKRENPMSLHVREFQLFMKRLRKKFAKYKDKKTGKIKYRKIRFYHCGEYGDLNQRPHYHACLFNFDFKDKILYREVQDYKLYTSASLQELWPYGFNTIGNVTFESAAYVARYIMKKINGDRQEKHYEYLDTNTGEILNRKPEYTTMSRRPGIGKAWFDKYNSDLYPSDFITIRGKKVRPPKFYDTQLEKLDPFKYDLIKEARLNNLNPNDPDNTPERLAQRETVKKSRIKQLTRNHDNERS